MPDDDAPEPEDIDPADWPEAVDAYRHAYNLARESVRDSAMDRGGDAKPGRELDRMKARLPLRRPAPADLAIRWGEADGTAGARPRW